MPCCGPSYLGLASNALTGAVVAGRDSCRLTNDDFLRVRNGVLVHTHDKIVHRLLMANVFLLLIFSAAGYWRVAPHASCHLPIWV